MARDAEIYMLRVGLANRDFRPGAERECAVRRLAELTDRPRRVIFLGRGK